MGSNNPMKLDANETSVFQRALEYIKSKTYDKKYKDLKATTLLPVSTEAPSGCQFITYRSFSMIGVAKIIADYANDFPRVDTFGEEKQAFVRGIGDSYGYSIPEIRRSQKEGTRLDSRRSNVARRANDEIVNTIAWTGDSNYKLQGFINFPGISEYTVPNGAGGNPQWSTKTPDEIVADVTGIINAVVVTTNGKEIPDTLLLPLSQFNLINDTRMAGNSDTTILQFILKNNQYLRSIEWLTELTGAGAGATDRFMVYPRDPDHVTLEIPQAFEQFPEQWKGMEAVIPCHSECGGVIVYFPLSVAFGDDI